MKREESWTWATLEPPVRAALALRVDRELARRAIPGAMIYFVMTLILLVTTPYNREHPQAFGFSVAITFLVGIVRLVTAWQLVSGSPAPIRTLFYATTYLTFIIWGLFCAMTVYFYATEWTAMFALMITTGLVSGGSSSLAPDFSLSWRCLSLMVVPTVCYQLVAGGEKRLAITAIIIVYFVFLLAQAKRHWQSFWAAGVAAEKEKLRGEAERSRSAAHTRALLQAVPDLILSLDERGAILDYKPAKENSGIPETNGSLNGTIDDLMPPDASSAMRGRIEQALQTGGLQTWTYEQTYPGEHSPRNLYARMSVSGDRQVVVVVQDITENVKLETALRESQRLESVGRLAGGVAHDFNNLLTIINGYSAMTLRDLQDGDLLRDPLGEILKAGRQAAGLTKQLLTFSRQQLVEARIVSLNQLVDESRDMMQRLLGEDVKLVTTLAPQLWPVMADPGQINQVLMNLAANSRDAMFSGGRMVIETTNAVLDHAISSQMGIEPGPYVLLSASDTGTGIDPETRQHIFEPFFTTKSRGKGTGLGLATVYGIVQQAGGAISVVSAPNEGTTFRIFLPRTVGAVTTDEAILPVPAGVGKETVLVVEDQPQVRRLTMAILKSRGYHVLEAATAGDAMLAAERYEGPIDLVLTDVVMPYMNGVELAGRLKPIRPEVPVLFMSGYSEEAINQGDITRGLNYLPKPFTPDQLAVKVRDILDRKSRA